jgi:hypothetical protein
MARLTQRLDLGGAFALHRGEPVTVTTAEERARPATGAVTQADGPVEGTGDDVSSTVQARLFALFLLAIGLLLAWWMKEKNAAFKPGEGFVLFAGFYVAAQTIERALELLPVGIGSKQAKANRAVIFPALGFVAGVWLAEKIGLFYLQAVGITSLSKTWDVVITALAIGGGTKPLHDAIKLIEKSKETPSTTT